MSDKKPDDSNPLGKVLKKIWEEEKEKEEANKNGSGSGANGGSGNDPGKKVVDNDDVYGIFRDLSTGKEHLVPDDFLEESLDEINYFLDNECEDLPDPVYRYVKAITEKAREMFEDELAKRRTI